MTKRQMNRRRKALKEYLADTYGKGMLMLDGPEFDGGIIGVSDGGRLVYSYGKLVDALAEANGWSREDAVDWVEFNTLRSLPYYGNAPVVVYDLDVDDFLKKS